MNDVSYDLIDYEYAIDDGLKEKSSHSYALFIGLWLLPCSVGAFLIFFLNAKVMGGAIIGFATFVAMIIKPVFGLSFFLLILPTGAGIGVEGVFTLSKMVGLLFGVSFLIHILICSPPLKVQHKALWIYLLYSLWIFLSTFWGVYFEVERNVLLTQLQLLFLVFIVYWITQNSKREEFIWLLRSYVIGVTGMLLYGVLSGHGAMLTQTAEGQRYAATIGRGIDANMFAVLVGLGLLTAIYLFFREKKILLKAIYILIIGFLPIMMLQIGSRGGIIAFGASIFMSWLSLKNLIKKPLLVVGLVVIVAVAFVFMTRYFEKQRMQEKVTERMTDTGMISGALEYRMGISRLAVKTAVEMPQGTSKSGWFVRTDAFSWPHSDFFYCLGVYGFPGAFLFALFTISILMVVFKIPTGLEQIYARSILFFLLVAGLGLTQVWTKHYWTFMVLILAIQRVNSLFETKDNNAQEYLTYEDIDCQPYVS